ncbi:putative nucleic acid-binding, RNA-binding domain, S1 [Helianthus annuus]|nr:putative nucleic acid-binding, RNA-binding domain, S1 [Helianthus annuus]
MTQFSGSGLARVRLKFLGSGWVKPVNTTRLAPLCSTTRPYLVCVCVSYFSPICITVFFQGYVKNVTPKGCFIMLSRKLDAKILISNLSDDFVSNPEEEFPIGKLVTGRVLSLEPLSKRIEVSLRKTSGS